MRLISYYLLGACKAHERHVNDFIIAGLPLKLEISIRNIFVL